MSNLLNNLFGKLYVGRWFVGTKVYIHWSWWVLLLMLLIVSPILVIEAIGALFLLSLHELGRSWAMFLLGVRRESSTLYLIAPISSGQIQKLLKEFVLCLAGSLGSLLVALVLWLLPSTDCYWLNTTLHDLFLINLLFLFLQVNPLYHPLDGGRVTRSLFGFSPLVATRITQVGCVLQGAVAIALQHYLLACVSLYICYIAEQEWYWDRLENPRVGPDCKE